MNQQQQNQKGNNNTMSRLTNHTAAELAHRDFALGDYEDEWRAVEGRYPEFTDYDVQEYLSAVKVAYRLQVFSSNEVIYA